MREIERTAEVESGAALAWQIVGYFCSNPAIKSRIEMGENCLEDLHSNRKQIIQHYKGINYKYMKYKKNV